MKKMTWALALLFLSLNGMTQTCEERETKLQTAFNGIHAGFLYNTYGLIGSITDGYTHEAYTAEQVTDLLKAQQKMAGNMYTLLEKMIKEDAFSSGLTRDYIQSSLPILKGLETQAGLFLAMVSNKNKKTTAAYEEQRNQNWQALSRLMGVKE